MDTTKNIAEDNLIYKVRCGSHAYGTSLSTSDVDYAGIFIPPVEYYFGLQAFDLLCEQTEEDTSYYSLRKYAQLGVANNPNVLELLFVDENDVCVSSEAASRLRRERHLFLSQRCQKTFVGYAKAQLHRIRTHTKWLEQEIHDMNILGKLVTDKKVTKEWVAWRFGENMLARCEVSYGTDCWLLEQMRSEVDILELFRSSNIICPSIQDKKFYVEKNMERGFQLYTSALIFQKHLYDEAKKKRDQYVTWMAERNPIRHETELKFGYDTKHAMHLIRLLRMGYEILTEGDLKVHRPDAEELLDIRAGKWTYKEITDYADNMVMQIDNVSPAKIKVPILPDTQVISRLIVDITQEHFGGINAK